MTTFRNNANGGTNGAAVSYTASGDAVSGVDWDFIAIGTNGSITYANNPARSALSYTMTLGATVTDVKVEWQNLQPSTTTYARFYVYLPALPSASFRFLELSDGTQAVWSFGLRNDGRLSIRDSVSASMGVSTISLPVGRWLRLEAMLVSHATTGSSVVKIFTEADSPYPAEIMTSTSSFNTAPNGTGISLARYGIVGSATSNYTYYLDDIAISNEGYLGPADPALVGPLELGNNADFGTNGTALTIANSGNATSRFFQNFTQAGQISFSNMQAAHGTLSYQFQAVSGSDNIVTWRGLHTNAAAMRFYFYFTANPAELNPFAQFTTGPGGFLQLAWLAVNLNGRLCVLDATSTVIWQAAAPLSLNTWYRFELFASLGGTATTGTIQAAYYVLDNPTAVDSFSTSTANLGTDPIAWARFGKIASSATYATPFYLDEIEIVQNASGFIGPYASLPAQPPAVPGTIPHLGWGREV